MDIRLGVGFLVGSNFSRRLLTRYANQKITTPITSLSQVNYTTTFIEGSSTWIFDCICVATTVTVLATIGKQWYFLRIQIKTCFLSHARTYEMQAISSKTEWLEAVRSFWKSIKQCKHNDTTRSKCPYNCCWSVQEEKTNRWTKERQKTERETERMEWAGAASLPANKAACT